MTGRRLVVSAGLRDDITSHLFRTRRATSSQLRARFPRATANQIRRSTQYLREDNVAIWRGAWPRDRAWWYLTEEGHERAILDLGQRRRPYRDQSRWNVHLDGTNDVGAVFCRLADTYAGDQCLWEVEVGHPYAPNRSVVPDAVIHYTVVLDYGEVGTLVRFVEYDRGTEPVSTLTAKLKAYMQLRTYTPPTKKGDTATRTQFLWQRYYAGFPPLLFVFDNMSAAAAERRGSLLCGAALSDQYISDNHGRLLDASYTTLKLLEGNDPFRTKVVFDVPSGVPRLLADRRGRPPPPKKTLRAAVPTISDLTQEQPSPPRPQG